MTQTFKDFEIIVVDDCSNDNSIELIKQFNDPRIKIFQNQKKLNAGMSRNIGLEISAGKYIYFVDSDDALMPNCLEIMYNAIEESQSDVVHANSHLMAEDPDFTYNTQFKVTRKSNRDPTPRFLTSNLYQRIMDEYIGDRINVVPWIKIIRRDFLFESGLHFPNVPIAEDNFQFLGELCFAKKIQVIDACVYIHRKNPTSLVNSQPEQRLKFALTSLPVAINFIKEILSSPNLIGELPLQFKRFLETDTVARYYFCHLSRLYKGELDFKRIDEIIDELVHKSSMIEPNLMKTFIHLVGFAMSR